jgi:hypothetical protein
LWCVGGSGGLKEMKMGLAVNGSQAQLIDGIEDRF